MGFFWMYASQESGIEIISHAVSLGPPIQLSLTGNELEIELVKL